MLRSKNSRVRIDPDLGPRGPDPCQCVPESKSKSPLITKIPGHNDTDSGSHFIFTKSCQAQQNHSHELVSEEVSCLPEYLPAKVPCHM